MGDVLKIRVVTSAADYRDFYAHTSAKLLRPFRFVPMLQNVLLWLVLSFCFMTLFQFKDGAVEKKEFWSVFVIGLSFIAYVGLGQWLQHKIAGRFRPNEDGIMLGAKEYELNQDGIKETQRFGWHWYTWDAVEQIEQVNGAIYVYVDKVHAVIFNAQSLASTSLKQELLSTLQRNTTKSSDAATARL